MDVSYKNMFLKIFQSLLSNIVKFSEIYSFLNYYFPFATLSANFLPTLNLTTFLAAILISFPV